MTLVLHLIRWDVRRFHVLLPLWLLLVSGAAVLEGAWPAMAVAMAARQTVGTSGNLLAVAEVLFSVVFIVLVVQEHPLVGTSAFWMTRPIPSRALLGAKIMLLGAAMVAAPVLAEVVLMIIYDVPARDIAAIALQTALYWALWLSIVMAFAALTPNMARFAAALGGVIVSIIVLLVTITAIMIDRADEAPPIPTAEQTYDPTSGVVTTLLLIAVAAGCLVTLYRTRARSRAIAIGIAGLAIAVAVTGEWPWPWLAPRIETPAWALEPSALQLSMAGTDVEMREGAQHFGDASSQWNVARGPMRLSGLAPGWSAGVGLREGSIRVNGREALTSRVSAHGVSVATNENETVRRNDAIRRVLNVNRLVDFGSQERPESAVVMVARIAELSQLAVDRADYEGTFLLSLVRHDIQAVFPLRSGAAVRTGAYQFTLDRIRRHSFRISVLARESGATSVFDRRPRSRVTYYLRNPYTSEAIQGSHRELRTDVTLTAVLPFTVGVDGADSSGFTPRALELNFPTAYGSQLPLAFDDRWVERAELVIVRSTEGGSVERRITIPDFPIRAQ